MPAQARKPGPASERDAVIKRMFFFTMCCSIGAAGFRPRSRAHDAGLSPCARNTIREAIGRDTSSSQHAGHAVRKNRTRSAAGTFSGHRQRSRRICHRKCGCRVSPTTSGSSTARDCACSSTVPINLQIDAMEPGPGFRRTWPYPHAMPSAAARKTQGARAHPPIPLDRPGGTPSVHSGRFPPLTGGCFLHSKKPHVKA
eukprot:scaffold448_cov68-Phaeocystis_antarctica.AAC.2